MNRFSLALVSVGSLSYLGALAQQAPAAALAPVTVTGNPLGAADWIAPATQYSGTELLLRTKTTLGETLDGTPGISSTYFGPNASRPIIRGLDGDRIRILNNGGAAVDASSLSYDHAVSTDPLSIERIEVLRGPGALQYGGSAVGGVINVIDSRIAREALFDAKGGVSGKASLAWASGNAERGGAGVIEAGNDRYALHADAFKRRTDDVSVPVALSCTRPGAAVLARRICNSASDSQGGALGGSLLLKDGYLGASVSGLRSDYGTVAEDEVTIGMKSDRYALQGELRGLSGWLQSIKGQLVRSVYQHTEYEGAEVGTVFKNRGTELRLEARHAKLGALDGLVGWQTDSVRFSADGEEAFAPYSQTRQSAVFAYEELSTGWGKLSFGARRELVRVTSLGNPSVARFVPARRSFQPASYALGALWNLPQGWQATGNLSYSERAPKDYELFANGPHIATHAYELGSPNFAKERSRNLDVGLNWRHGAHRVAVGAFVNRFQDYIAQQATGRNRDTAGNGAAAGVADCGDGTSAESGCVAELLPEYVYIQVPARFKGLEASASVRLLEGPTAVDLQLRGDLLRARDLGTGQALPRMAPARLGATMLWTHGMWRGSVGASHLAAQTRVPSGQRASEAYTLWNAGLSYRLQAGTAKLLWFARLDNARDTLAYSATSILSQTAPGKAPLPGRSIKVGLQGHF
ncbi:TonB-dependent receptor [Rhodoferax sp.]|uniref:TonB-dependent receptor n=1 Tax=Rhodoferax sp. TaxID=50421 RepID=UPI002760C158|nr:TonB-dependent receptor [Rhodoferax sp.]